MCPETVGYPSSTPRGPIDRVEQDPAGLSASKSAHEMRAPPSGDDGVAEHVVVNILDVDMNSRSGPAESRRRCGKR
jgi:hypothetical protein